MRSARRASRPPAAGLRTCRGDVGRRQGDGGSCSPARERQGQRRRSQRQPMDPHHATPPLRARPALSRLLSGTAARASSHLHRAGAGHPEGALRAAVEVELERAGAPGPGHRQVVPAVIQPGGGTSGGPHRGAGGQALGDCTRTAWRRRQQSLSRAAGERLRQAIQNACGAGTTRCVPRQAWGRPLTSPPQSRPSGRSACRCRPCWSADRAKQVRTRGRRKRGGRELGQAAAGGGGAGGAGGAARARLLALMCTDSAPRVEKVW